MADTTTTGPLTVGGGNMSYGEGVTDSGSKTTSSSSSSSASGVEQWYQNYEKDLLAKAQAEAAKGYNPYTGQRQAGFNTDQLGAMNMIREAVENPAYQQYVDQWAPTLSGVPGMMGQGAAMIGASGTYNPQGFEQMYAQYSPAIQAMQAEAQRVGSQDFANTTLAQLNRAFGGTGGWGGSRNQILGADAAARAQAEITGKQAAMEMQGRTSAAQDYLNWARQGTTAGQGLVGAGQNILGGAQNALKYGTDIQSAIGSDASALANIGKQQQDFSQQGLDIAYQNFLKQQQFPWEQINAYTNVLKSAPAPTWNSSSSSSSNISDQWSSGKNYNVGLTMPNEQTLTGSDFNEFLKGFTGGAGLAGTLTGTGTGTNPANVVKP